MGPVSTWTFGADAIVIATGFTNMFKNAAAFNSPIFKVAATATTTEQTAVNDLTSMFEGATAFNQLINTATGLWKVDRVVTFTSMFEGATAFNQNINDWTLTAAATANLDKMFKSATNYAHNLCGWNSELLTAASSTEMFEGTKCPTKTAAFTAATAIDTGDICCSCDGADKPANLVICADVTR